MRPHKLESDTLLGSSYVMKPVWDDRLSHSNLLCPNKRANYLDTQPSAPYNLPANMKIHHLL